MNLVRKCFIAHFNAFGFLVLSLMIFIFSDNRNKSFRMKLISLMLSYMSEMPILRGAKWTLQLCSPTYLSHPMGSIPSEHRETSYRMSGSMSFQFLKVHYYLHLECTVNCSVCQLFLSVLINI